MADQKENGINEPMAQSLDEKAEEKDPISIQSRDEANAEMAASIIEGKSSDTSGPFGHRGSGRGCIFEKQKPPKKVAIGRGRGHGYAFYRSTMGGGGPIVNRGGRASQLPVIDNYGQRDQMVIHRGHGVIWVDREKFLKGYYDQPDIE